MPTTEAEPARRADAAAARAAGRASHAHGRSTVLARRHGDPHPRHRPPFPEGPIALDDGSVLLVEIARGTLTQVAADGTVEVVAETGGGPNGAAIGPDGAVYICNNGGCFEWDEVMGLTLPGARARRRGPAAASSGSTSPPARSRTLYTESSGRPLRAPNDLVFDAHGGFWFTDHGVRARAHAATAPGLHYAKADGSSCEEVVFPLDAPNGIGLSPDGSTALRRRDPHRPGVLVAGRPARARCGRPRPSATAATLLAGLPGMQLLDSLAVDGEGWVCVGTLVNGGITAISPDGATVEHFAAARPAGHQHLLRRAGPAHGLRHAVGHRPAGRRSTGPARACASHHTRLSVESGPRRARQ